MRTSVVFPAPAGPSSAWISPGRMARDTPSTASVEPNCRDTSRSVMTGARMGAASGSYRLISSCRTI